MKNLEYVNKGLEELEDKVREDLDRIRVRTIGDDKVLTYKHRFINYLIKYQT